MSKIAIALIVACTFQVLQAQLVRPGSLQPGAVIGNPQERLPSVPELNVNLPINPEEVINHIQENIHDGLSNIPELDVNFPINREQVIDHIQGIIPDHIPQIQIPQVQLPSEIINRVPTGILSHLSHIQKRIQELANRVPDIRSAIGNCIRGEKENVKTLIDVLKADTNRLILSVENAASNVQNAFDKVITEIHEIEEIIDQLSVDLPPAIEEADIGDIITILKDSADVFVLPVSEIQGALYNVANELASNIAVIGNEADQINEDALRESNLILHNVITCIIANSPPAK